jgi:hypothetical protein
MDVLGKYIPSIYSTVETMYQEPRTIEQDPVMQDTYLLLVVYPL